MAFFETARLKDENGNIIGPAKEDSLTLLRGIFRLLKPLGVITGGGSNRLNVDVNTIVGGTLGTVNTVSTVSTVTNISTIANITAFELMKSMARTAYNTGIRSKLS